MIVFICFMLGGNMEVRCFKCEMLVDDEPIKVIAFKSNSPFGDDIYHFVDGFRCMYNGVESLDVADLCKGRCRLRGE